MSHRFTNIATAICFVAVTLLTVTSLLGFRGPPEAHENTLPTRTESGS